MGHSQGGLLASLAAAKDSLKDSLSGVISLSGGYALIDEIVYGFEEKSLPEFADLKGTKVGKAYLESAFRHKGYLEEIKGYQGRVLLAVGEKDNMVSPESVELVYRMSYYPQGLYYLLPDVGHGFSSFELDTIYPGILEPFLSSE